MTNPNQTDDPTTLPDATRALVPPRRAGTARILHTSDWHLGVQVRNESRGVDHDALIDELVAIAALAEPDVIVHTGDLFDGARPPMPDLERAIRAMRRLSEIAPVALLAGNHDSAGTLKVLATAVEDDLESRLAAGTWDPHRPCPVPVRVHHSLVRPERGLVATYAGRHGVDVRLACLPFVHANRTLTDFDRVLEANATYADSMRVLVEAVTRTAAEQLDRSRQVMVLASHVHIGGAKVSSERTLHVSETYAADERQLPDGYAYVALGHIHVPQPVAGGRGRYAGSLLEVDFGEEGESKRTVLVDCEPGRPAEIVSVPLTAGRRLRRVSVTLAELGGLVEDLEGTIAEITVVSPGGPAAVEPVVADGGAGAEPESLDATVRALLPGTTVVQVIDARRRRKPPIDGGGRGPVDGAAPPSTTEQLRRWLAGAGSGRLRDGADVERVGALFDVLLTAALDGRPFVHPQQAELDARVGGR